ncbi:MAG: response regulator [Desulfobacterales bacterium]
MTTVPKKILIVDDDEDKRQVTKKALVNFGYEPECVKNGKEALALLNKEKFPIVLMDLRLPEINSFTYEYQYIGKMPVLWVSFL